MAEWNFELYHWQNDDVMITRWKSSWSSIIRSMWDPSLKVSNSSEASTLKDGVKLNKPKIMLWIERKFFNINTLMNECGQKYLALWFSIPLSINLQKQKPNIIIILETALSRLFPFSFEFFATRHKVSRVKVDWHVNARNMFLEPNQCLHIPQQMNLPLLKHGWNNIKTIFP